MSLVTVVVAEDDVVGAKVSISREGDLPWRVRGRSRYTGNVMRCSVRFAVVVAAVSGCDNKDTGPSTGASTLAPSTAADDGSATNTSSSTSGKGDETSPGSAAEDTATSSSSNGSSDGGAAETVLAINGCEAPSDSCSCTPLQDAHACTHNFGGVYANLGCSGSFQCCDGQWSAGLGVCGACSCADATGEAGCEAPGGATAICYPTFQGTSSEIPADVQAEMTGLSWKPDLPCPPFSDLRLLRLSHWNFDGSVSDGELVVHRDVADAMLGVFEQLYAARFPIERMVRVDAYNADDDASMAANNTSAFNCRLTTSGNSLSQHSYGRAIDINPIQNPYVSSGGNVYPPAGSAYLDRSSVRTGMIVDPGPAVAAFDTLGWGWGGRWSSIKDYQHFSENGQ